MIAKYFGGVLEEAYKDRCTVYAMRRVRKKGGIDHLR